MASVFCVSSSRCRGLVCSLWLWHFLIILTYFLIFAGIFSRDVFSIFLYWYEHVHEISNNVVCATSKGSDQPVHTHSLIRAFASRLSILWLLSYWLNTYFLIFSGIFSRDVFSIYLYWYIGFQQLELPGTDVCILSIIQSSTMLSTLPSKIYGPLSRENILWGSPIMLDSQQPTQLQKLARALKFYMQQTVVSYFLETKPQMMHRQVCVFVVRMQQSTVFSRRGPLI